MKKVQVEIHGVDCANCAAKIEDKIQKLSGIHEASYLFMNEKLTFTCEESEENRLMNEIEKIVHLIEPDAEIHKKTKHHHKHEEHHHHEHCGCKEHHHHEHDEHCGCKEHHHHEHDEHCGCKEHHHHEHDEHCGCKEHHHEHDEHCGCKEHHHHEHDEHCGCGEHHHHEHNEHCECGEHHHHEHVESVENLHQKYQYRLVGLDCANCAAKVERYLNRQSELSDVQISFMNQSLKLNSTLPASEIKNFVQKKVDEVEDGVTVEEISVKKAEKKDEKKIDTELLRILIAIVFLVMGFVMHEQFILSLILFACCYLCVGAEILLRALRNIIKGQVFDENFLMAVATIGAIVVSEYAEACAVMVFYQIGEYFQNRAVEKSRRSISELMDIRPDEAHVERGGKLFTVNPEDVEIGEILVVRAGEKIPVDGVVVEGKTSLDTRALTGESKYTTVEENDEVLSGVINVEGVIRVKTTKDYSDSTVARILDLVENAGSRKAPAEAFITKFAKVYTPLVCLLALLIALIPPMLIEGAQWMDYLYRACTFLVISCPCALVVSVPLSYFAGIGGLSSSGILVKGSNYLDALNYVDTYVFDKTGTLTKGNFELTEVLSEYPEDCLSVAASIEKHSNHPIAQSIVRAYDGVFMEVEHVHEIAGRGIIAEISGKQVLAGNERLMEMHQIQIVPTEKTGTVIYVAKDGQYLGALIIQDEIRPEAKVLISELKHSGKKVVMLTGDQKSIADEVAKELSVDEVHAELLPQDKVQVVEKMISSGRKTAFAGDGINDAPVLAISSVGFAMGGIGSDAAIEAADVVIMNDNPYSIVTALKSAIKTRKIVMENIYGALFVKFVILLLGAVGKVGMWAAVFADVGVAVIAILNAIRAMKVK